MSKTEVRNQLKKVVQYHKELHKHFCKSAEALKAMQKDGVIADPTWNSSKTVARFYYIGRIFQLQFSAHTVSGIVCGVITLLEECPLTKTFRRHTSLSLRHDGEKISDSSDYLLISNPENFSSYLYSELTTATNYAPSPLLTCADSSGG